MNIYQPTPADVLAWAYSASAWPDADWDHSIVSSDENDSVVLALANDIHCPNRKVFVHCLYWLVGENWIEGRFLEVSLPRINLLTDRVTDSFLSDVITWAARTRLLRDGKIEFNSQLWLHYCTTDEWCE